MGDRAEGGGIAASWLAASRQRLLATSLLSPEPPSVVLSNSWHFILNLHLYLLFNIFFMMKTG